MKKYKKTNTYDQKPETTHGGSVNLIRLIKNGESKAEIATMNKAWLNKGQQFNSHKHSDSIEYFYILSGTGIMIIGNDRVDVKTGDFITIPMNTLHSLKNENDKTLEFISLRGLLE